MGRAVVRCCCAARQNIWVDLWGDACVRWVLTLSWCFSVLSPAEHGGGDWISSHDCARHATVSGYIGPSD